jgi:hypothetical protein
MLSSYNPQWQDNRINFILKQYPAEFFEGKRILELGPFNGYIGYKFTLLGAEVHCVEGRQSNVDSIRHTYPSLSVEQANLDTSDWPWGSWDIIINFGLYYHLEHYHREHMMNCLNNCNLMFFESVIYDSAEPELYIAPEAGNDQSLTDKAGTPSTSYVENIFKDANVNFTKYSLAELNAYSHHYDWVDKNSKIIDRYARRFWIVSVP